MLVAVTPGTLALAFVPPPPLLLLQLVTARVMAAKRTTARRYMLQPPFSGRDLRCAKPGERPAPRRGWTRPPDARCGQAALRAPTGLPGSAGPARRLGRPSLQ